ncbi:MAG: polysaccharide biosynthesis protein [Muribaculaceae bacterium]|nr:polysaccharide biosynthesis protein [Muribaculaceae bacterium]
MSTSDSKRIAKNTMMLYFRMLLSMGISLYTSRVVLQVLGVSDFGVYGVVGGVIGMFSFINASMAGATSRFITYELGKGDTEKLRLTFSSAVIIHIIIAAIVLMLSETVGLWFLMNKLVIPDSARTAAFWVYQLSILSAMMGITQVPYTACIMSHEKMSIYAYIEILNSALKLGVVFLLMWIPGVKLIIYALLLLGASTIILMIYRIYAIHNFKECRMIWKWDGSIIKPMISFSGWDVYGNLCGMAFYQGTTFLLNIFFGVVTNAANSIANTVSGIIVGLSNNVTAAYRPHIIKQYAAGNIKAMSTAMNQGVMAVMLLSGLVVIPAYIEMPQVIKLWLGEIPPYTVEFCRWLMVFFMLGQINAYCIMAIHATGRIKWLSFAGGTAYLLTVPSIWLAFKFGLTPQWAYIIHVAFRLIILLIDMIIMRNLIPTLGLRRFTFTVCKTGIVIIAVFIMCKWLSSLLTADFMRIIEITLISSFTLVIIAFTLLLDNSQKQFLLSKMRMITHRITNH